MKAVFVKGTKRRSYISTKQGNIRRFGSEREAERAILRAPSNNYVITNYSKR